MNLKVEFKGSSTLLANSAINGAEFKHLCCFHVRTETAPGIDAPRSLPARLCTAQPIAFEHSNFESDDAISPSTVHGDGPHPLLWPTPAADPPHGRSWVFWRSLRSRQRCHRPPHLQSLLHFCHSGTHNETTRSPGSSCQSAKILTVGSVVAIKVSERQFVQ